MKSEPVSFVIRPARIDDCPVIHHLIVELAHYEKLADQVTATPEMIRRSLFGEPKHADAIVAEVGGSIVGFALYFSSYSTFLAKAGIYLEDLFVLPEMRGRGIGKALLCRLAQLAVEKGCGRLEWSVLDWNKPAIDFYRSLGAQPMDEWTVYRLTDEKLSSLAKSAR